VADRGAAGRQFAAGPPPLALYVHLPWCVRKCPYCDFNSHAADRALPEQAYVDALLSDLDDQLGSPAARRPLVSVFIGGGTPSLFSGAAIGRLLDGVRARCELADDVEITLEANPGAVDAGHFHGYRQAGVNRLSIGVQSLSAGHLDALGRIHDPAQARAAVTAARAAGFDNINLDMMFGLPGQSVQEAGADLDALIALAPEHISYYQLTLEPNTAFAHAPPNVPDEDALDAMQQQGTARLAGAGFGRYEVSA
jgi:oxygen-independent coproporphyrinogen-3 oxidase